MIFRNDKHKEKFTILDNQLINDIRLSFKALGLLVYYLSKPPHWKIRREELYKARGVGRRYVESAFEELVTYGYMAEEDGEWNIYETPRPVQNVTPGQNAQGQVKEINPSEGVQNEQEPYAEGTPKTVQKEHSDRGTKVLTKSPYEKDCKNNMGSLLRKDGGSDDVLVDIAPHLPSNSANANRDEEQLAKQKLSEEIASNRILQAEQERQRQLKFDEMKRQAREDWLKLPEHLRPAPGKTPTREQFMAYLQMED